MNKITAMNDANEAGRFFVHLCGCPRHK